MSKIDLVSILVRQLCEVDDHESDLAEDALYDFVSNPNTSLSEKQDALALIERKIKHIAEDIGFFEEEDISVRISDKDKFALYSLLVARRYLMDQIMGEPSKDYVERVSYQSDKLAMLMAECLKQGTEMWDAVQNSSSFKANDYLQYGEYVLEYKADSCQAVLVLEDDDAYGSAFPFIHRLIYTLGEQINLAGHESFAAAEGAIGIAEKANKVRQKPLRVILNGLGKDAAKIISRINGFTFVETSYDPYTNTVTEVERIAYSEPPPHQGVNVLLISSLE